MVVAGGDSTHQSGGAAEAEITLFYFHLSSFVILNYVILFHFEGLYRQKAFFSSFF